MELLGTNQKKNFWKNLNEYEFHIDQFLTNFFIKSKTNYKKFWVLETVGIPLNVNPLKISDKFDKSQKYHQKHDFC